jgi:hypothetical protein
MHAHPRLADRTVPGWHMFFLFAERQRFLDQASRFLAR